MPLEHLYKVEQSLKAIIEIIPVFKQFLILIFTYFSFDFYCIQFLNTLLLIIELLWICYNMALEIFSNGTGIKASFGAVAVLDVHG